MPLPNHNAVRIPVATDLEAADPMNRNPAARLAV